MIRRAGLAIAFDAGVAHGVASNITSVPLGRNCRESGAAAVFGAGRLIVAYPEGKSRRGPLLTWNAGPCCGYAMEQRVDDVAFIRPPA